MNLSQQDRLLWNIRRLQIMHRDGFKCKSCGSDAGLLHVHHKMYDNRHRFWEYMDEHLVTLCAACHGEEHRYTPISDFYNKNWKLAKYKFSTAILAEFGLKQKDLMITPLQRSQLRHTR